MKDFARKDSKDFLSNQNYDVNTHSLIWHAQEGNLTVVKHLINASIEVNDKHEGFLAINRVTWNPVLKSLTLALI